MCVGIEYGLVVGGQQRKKKKAGAADLCLYLASLIQMPACLSSASE